jgi:uncharacterized DUF497 family protein
LTKINKESIMELRFEWDEEKNKINLRKHGISFEEAAVVFSDSMRIEIYDRRHSFYEERWKVFGLSMLTVLVISCTVINGIIRIFSVRKATKIEEEEYFYGYGSIHTN